MRDLLNIIQQIVALRNASPGKVERQTDRESERARQTEEREVGKN